MTFRSPRALFVVLPLFLAAGFAVACVPYQMPVGPPAAPSGYQPGVLTSHALPPQSPCTSPAFPAPSPYVQAYPPSGHVWVLSVADGKLHLQTAEGTRSTCEKMTILVNGVEPVAVTVSEHLIHLSAGSEACKSSCHLRATAKKVSRTGPNGATLVLEGRATLSYSRNGKKIVVSTDLLSVNVASGQVISEMQVQPVTPVTPCCVTGSDPAQCPPACPSPRVSP